MTIRSKWMEGLLYAENECKTEIGVIVLINTIELVFLSDNYDDFDRGIRDYLNYRHSTLGQSNINEEGGLW